MKKARDPITGKLFDGDEWVENCGDRRQGVCGMCCSRVFLKVSKNGAKHFFHEANIKCTIKDHKPFKHLQAKYLDKKNAKLKKQYLLENSYACFEKCRSIAEGLTTLDFLEMVQIGNKFGIWNFQGLPVKYIPYILLTCRNRFQKSEGGKDRATNYYFTFRPNFTYIDFLWNYPSMFGRKFLKVSPKTGIIEEYSIDSYQNDLPKIPQWFESTQEILNDILNDSGDDL